MTIAELVLMMVRYISDGPFKGQFEYNPDCSLCAAHGEFCVTSSSGIPVNLMLTDDQKVLIATIAAEGAVTLVGSEVSSQARQAMANVALNCVGQREWARYHSVAQICQYTGFDGYGTNNYYACMTYLNNRDGNNGMYEQIVWDVLAAYNSDITNGCQLYFTPAAMGNPGAFPNDWNRSVLEEVEIFGVDPYYEGRFFRYN